MKVLQQIALGATMVAFMAACNNQQPQGQTAANTSATDASAEARSEATVYVNSDSLLNNYEYFKEVRARLQAKSEEAEKDLRNKATAFQRDVERYQQTAQGMTMQQRATTEQRLAERQQQLSQLSQNTGNELVGEESEEMKKIYDKVEAYLQNVSKEKGYKMVLTYSRGNSAILFGDSSLDITSEVVKGLNEQYEAEKKATAAKTDEKKK